MGAASYATVADYEARYGEVDDTERVSTLLSDATAFVDAQAGFRFDPSDRVQQANLVRVVCAVVYRSMSAGDLAGVSSYSQGAVGYTASVSVYNPSGDFYLTKAEKQALGIRGSVVGTIPAAIHAPCGEVAWPCV